MNYMELLIDLHKEAERQGPGSEADTLKALSFIELPEDQRLQIADIGCGSGAQTLTLAKQLNADISAVDLFPEFLDQLTRRAKEHGVSGKIIPLKASMDSLPFEKESLDMIWSEGAIYNMGFEKGIQQWKDYLKPGGYLAFSEITWISQTRPKEIDEFWSREYPEIDTASNKIKILETNGYTLTGYFYISPTSWLKHYYEPQQKSFDIFLQRHHHSALAEQVVSDHQAEIDLYEKFKNYYSYGFYVARKEG